METLYQLLSKNRLLLDIVSYQCTGHVHTEPVAKAMRNPSRVTMTGRYCAESLFCRDCAM